MKETSVFSNSCLCNKNLTKSMNKINLNLDNEGAQSFPLIMRYFDTAYYRDVCRCNTCTLYLILICTCGDALNAVT